MSSPSPPVSVTPSVSSSPLSTQFIPSNPVKWTLRENAAKMSRCNKVVKNLLPLRHLTLFMFIRCIFSRHPSKPYCLPSSLRLSFVPFLFGQLNFFARSLANSSFSTFSFYTLFHKEYYRVVTRVITKRGV